MHAYAWLDGVVTRSTDELLSFVVNTLPSLSANAIDARATATFPSMYGGTCLGAERASAGMSRLR
jgi:hypothetical protein